jgi:hypothetical protein
MYNLSWARLVKLNVPSERTKLFDLLWFGLLVSQIKYVYDQFITYRLSVLYALRHNSQVMYLEKFLNDKFDPIGRGIYIQTTDVSKMYIYTKAEHNTRVYLYRKYNSTINYQIGDFATYGFYVYKCIAVSIGNLPTNSVYWVVYKGRPIAHKKIEYNTPFDFTVKVPVSLILDRNMMITNINYYKYAGVRFTIITY